MSDQKKADMRGWTLEKHLRGWTPEYGWAPKKGHKVKRNVPIDKSSTKGRDPIAVELERRCAEIPKDKVTVERLEWALAMVAYLISRDGPKLVPLFERLERELAVMRQVKDSMERAKRLLGSYSGGHPRLLLAPPERVSAA